jgi:hypothetical protein
MKSSIFWDITPCSPLEVDKRFGVIYRLHLQAKIISQAEALPVTCFILGLFFDHEDGCNMFL